ncbi:hypothetical protein V8E36_004580 [Tilletia maclaganii]
MVLVVSSRALSLHLLTSRLAAAAADAGLRTASGSSADNDHRRLHPDCSCAARADAVTTSCHSQDDGTPVTTVIIALKAGPRYGSAPGVARESFFTSTQNRSALALIHEVEHSSPTVGFFVPLLGEAFSSSTFRRREFREEVIPQLASDAEQAADNPLILDRIPTPRGVGASLFASPIHPVSHAQTVAFSRSAVAKNNFVILGSDIDFGKRANVVSKSFPGVSTSGLVTKSASAYKGGEQRKAHFFLGFEGAATGAKPELAVKWSAGQSPLSHIAAKDPAVCASTFNLTFAPPAKISATVKSVTAALKEAASKIGGEDLKEAIVKAKHDAATPFEARSGSHEAVAGTVSVSRG